MNTGPGQWVTISTIATSHPTVHVYDNPYPGSGTHQIAAVKATEKPKLLLKFMDVPTQSGTYDGWLFTLAVVTAPALGEKPKLFVFEQSKMWAHLRQCLEGGGDANLPSHVKKQCKEVLSEDNRSAGCLNYPVISDHMIEYTHCKEWYH